jgi:outer membrane protein
MRLKLASLALLMTALVGTGFAKDFKIGYIHSQKVMAELPESIEAQKTLDEEQKKWLDQAKKKEDEISKMEDKLQNQSLMLSEQKKTEMQQDIQTRYMEYQRFQQEIWGEQGKLYLRNKELTSPIIDKVNAVINKLGKDNGYDVIFDASVGNIVYAKPDFDMTQMVLDDLNKK